MTRGWEQHRPGLIGRRAAVWLAVATTALLGAVVLPHASAVAPPADGWQVMATPSGVAAGSQLLAVSCVSVDDCTAVGYGDGENSPLIEHYDGTGWSPQTVSLSGSGMHVLNGVSCPDADHCTAVGFTGNGSLIVQKTASGWSEVTAPGVGSNEELRAVSCADATDCVAVGTYYDYNSYSYATFSDVWSGSSWSEVSTPNYGNNVNEVASVSCPDTTDCYLAGYYSSSGSGEQLLLAHYNGSSWSIQGVTDPGTTNNELNGIDCLSSTDCTAVGYASSTGVGSQSVVEQWDGTSWSQASGVPAVGQLDAVSCASATACAAVGQTSLSGSDIAVLGYDGNSWSQVSAPDPGNWENALDGVACPAAGTCFGVGHRQDGNSEPAYAAIETSLQQPQPVVAAVHNDSPGTVTLTGSGFTGASAVSFGAVAATDFSVDSDTQITVTVPAGAVSDDVVVTTPVGSSVAWFADKYYPPPAVTAVSPNSGSDQGGDTVTITGSGFTGASEVYFDNGEWGWDAAGFTVDSDNQITVTTPYTDWDGPTDVRVTAPGGQSAATEADVFTFGTATHTTVSADQWTVYPNETATVTAVVTTGTGDIPTGGTVAFADSHGTLPGCGAVPLADTGTADCAVSYPSVRHTAVTATYSGYSDETNGSVYTTSSAVHELVVDQQPTTGELSYTAHGPDAVYTMTVSPVPDGGSVTFTQDHTPLPGCGALALADDGTAQCSVHYTDPGSPKIYASYSGNADYSPADASVTATISAGSTLPTATTVTAAPAGPAPGALVQYVAQVAAAQSGSPSGGGTDAPGYVTAGDPPDGGTVAFTVDGNPVEGCDAQPVDANGKATCVAVSGAAGGHQLAADYSGDLSFAASQGTAAVTVTAASGGGGGGPQATGTAVEASADPRAGSPVTYTATVTPTPDDGTITFADNGDAIAGCTSLGFVAGVATCTTTYSTTGAHTIVAGYSGDAGFSPSTAHVDVTIGAPASTTATGVDLAAAPTDPVTGQLVTLTATVDPAPDGGTVAFADGSTPVSGCAAVAVDIYTGIARCQIAYGATGSHAFTAAYSGDTLYDPSTSAAADVTVSAPAGGGGLTAVTTTLGANPTQPAPGDPVTLTADLDPAAAGGSVTFLDGGDPITHCSSAPVSSGSAQCTVTFPTGGAHTLRAAYSGDATYAPSTSAALPLTVQAATTTTFTDGPGQVTSNSTHTYTVTVSPAPPGGTVAFGLGGSAVAGCQSVAVDTTTGKASCSITLSAAGANTLTADFTGTTGFAGSSATQTVNVLVPVTVSASYSLTPDWQYAYTVSYGCGGTFDPQTCSYDVYAPAWDVTFTAYVAPAAGSAPVFGNISFQPSGGSVGCTASVYGGGGASCTVYAVSPQGPEHVTAIYSGDVNHAGGSSAATEVDIPFPTTTAVTASSTAPAVGDSVTLSVLVSRVVSDDNGGTTPLSSAGTLSFTDDGTAIPGCTDVPLNTFSLNPVTTCATSFGTAGKHTVEATFSGTGTDQGSSGDLSIDVATAGYVPPAAPSGVKDVQTAVSNSPNTTADASANGVSVSGKGAGALTIGDYPAPPNGLRKLGGKYFDLKLAPGSAFKDVVVTDCNLGGQTALYFWNGRAWVAASNQVYDRSTNPPCVTATIGPKTTPSLSQLTGTVFGVGAAPSAGETPALSAASPSAGVLTVTVRTRPAVPNRTVVVYYLVKRRGHKAVLRVLARQMTGRGGLARLRLAEPSGTVLRLRARMLGKDYTENLSRVVRVRVR